MMMDGDDEELFPSALVLKCSAKRDIVFVV